MFGKEFILSATIQEILGVFLSFSLHFLGVASWFGIWSILGITEFYAAHDSLTISYKLLGMFRKISLLTKDIDYFNQFLNESSEGKSWHLEIVTNRRISNKNQSFPAWISKDRVTRINYKTIHIYAHANPSLSEWLGNVLADFYGSRFQSISQPNNPVAHRPNQDSRKRLMALDLVGRSCDLVAAVPAPRASSRCTTVEIGRWAQGFGVIADRPFTQSTRTVTVI